MVVSFETALLYSAGIGSGDLIFFIYSPINSWHRTKDGLHPTWNSCRELRSPDDCSSHRIFHNMQVSG